MCCFIFVHFICLYLVVKASIDWKYHYAGASARYMFDFHIEECVFAISEAVNYCGNYKEIFQGKKKKKLHL